MGGKPRLKSRDGKAVGSKLINTKEVVTTIARMAGKELTVDQVRLCFELYRKLVYNLIDLTEMTGTTLVIPRIGRIHFIKKAGFKKGEQIFDVYYKKKKTYEEDQPDYDVLKVELSKNYANYAKEKSSERWRKKRVSEAVVASKKEFKKTMIGGVDNDIES